MELVVLPCEFPDELEDVLGDGLLVELEDEPPDELPDEPPGLVELPAGLPVELEVPPLVQETCWF